MNSMGESMAHMLRVGTGTQPPWRAAVDWWPQVSSCTGEGVVIPWMKSVSTIQLFAEYDVGAMNLP